MIEKLELFKGLLKASNWNENRTRLSKDLFPEELQDLYDSLAIAHDINPNDLTLNEVYSIHKNTNRTLTESNKAVIREILTSVKECEDISQESFKYLLNEALSETKAMQIARVALEISQGKHENWEKIDEILRTDVRQEEIKIVSTDIKQLSDDISKSYRWRFNLPELDGYCGPIGPEMFIILAGPVNCGKSAAAVSFTFSPQGFLEQGARCLYIGNEESLKRTMMRGVSSYTGMTKKEIVENLPQAQKLFDKVRANCFMIDDYSMTFTKLNYIVSKIKPDIVIIDMLDKVLIDGTFMRTDEKLGRIYEQARELAKRHQCCVFGLSQTSAESFGKLYYSFDRLAGSRVEKGANADTVLLLGAHTNEYDTDADSNFRVINIAKSKDEGNGKKVQCRIQPLLSRITA